MEITSCRACRFFFFSGTKCSKRAARREKDDHRSERTLTRRTGQYRVGLVDIMWRSSIDFSNDLKSIGHGKGLCLEDYHRRFGHVWNVTGLAVPCREEHHRIGKPFLFTLILLPCDFFLFLKQKGIIKGARFEGVEASNPAITTELRESLDQCIEAWQKYLGKCLKLDGRLLWRENYVVSCLILELFVTPILLLFWQNV